jgi:hypothetical protein
VACCFAWGDMSPSRMQRSLRLFAEEVMPVFQVSAAAA